MARAEEEVPDNVRGLGAAPVKSSGSSNYQVRHCSAPALARFRWTVAGSLLPFASFLPSVDDGEARAHSLDSLRHFYLQSPVGSAHFSPTL